MDVRQLSALVAIADHGSFSAAARALYTVQSNISGHVARLERELGVTLVDRQRGGLTEDGRVVVERARRIIHDLDEISAEMASRGEEIHGDARIGIIGTTARWLLPRALGRLRSEHPGIHPIINEGNTTTLVARVQSSHLDAAIVHLPLEEADVSVEPLFSEDLILIAPAGHRFAGRSTLTLAELADERLILPPAGTAFRRVLDRGAAAAGVELQPKAEIDGVRLMASLAFEGFGATLAPATAIPNWLDGAFTGVPVPELPRRVVAWVQRKRPLPGAATRAVLTLLRKLVVEYGTAQPGVYVGGGSPKTGSD